MDSGRFRVTDIAEGFITPLSSFRESTKLMYLSKFYIGTYLDSSVHDLLKRELCLLLEPEGLSESSASVSQLSRVVRQGHIERPYSLSTFDGGG